MALIVSYGTLQLEAVQLSTFGRLLQGRPDALPGFEPSLSRIEDPQVVAISGKTHHKNVTYNARPEPPASPLPVVIHRIHATRDRISEI